MKTSCSYIEAVAVWRGLNCVEQAPCCAFTMSTLLAYMFERTKEETLAHLMGEVAACERVPPGESDPRD